MPDEVHETPCLEFEILDRNGTAITVEFKNPYYIGVFEDVENEEGETVQVDNDPNKHMVKSVNIPLTDDGTPDLVALNEVLCSQARGVSNRIETNRVINQTVNEESLEGLVGLSEI